MKNFASANSGASVLRSSKNIVNKTAILSAKDDVYMSNTRCYADMQEEIIINLSDDVQIGTILVTDHEDFSA